MIDDDDAEAPRALGVIGKKRLVYISCAESNDGGWKSTLRPLHLRFSNNTDPAAILVTWYGDDMWVKEELRLTEWLQDVDDFILLVDDNTPPKLRQTPDFDSLKPEPGMELGFVLRNNDRIADEAERARIWLTLVHTVRLIGLQAIAGNAAWNLKQFDERKRLHWFYPADEKLDLKGKSPTGKADTLLSDRIDRFVQHERPRCEWCGGIHDGKPPPGGG